MSINNTLEKLKSNLNYMNNNKISSLSEKEYKTESVAKRAQTIQNKRKIKQEKQEAYANSEKKIKREATIDYKKNYQTKLQDAIEKNMKYQESKQMKTFHISAKIEQTITFKDKYSNKTKSYKHRDLKENHHLKYKTQMIKETEVIKARNYDLAKEQFINNVENKFSSGGGGSSSKSGDAVLDSFFLYKKSII